MKLCYTNFAIRTLLYELCYIHFLSSGRVILKDKSNITDGFAFAQASLLVLFSVKKHLSQKVKRSKPCPTFSREGSQLFRRFLTRFLVVDLFLFLK